MLTALSESYLALWSVITLYTDTELRACEQEAGARSPEVPDVDPNGKVAELMSGAISSQPQSAPDTPTYDDYDSKLSSASQPCLYPRICCSHPFCNAAGWSKRSRAMTAHCWSSLSLWLWC